MSFFGTYKKLEILQILHARAAKRVLKVVLKVVLKAV